MDVGGEQQRCREAMTTFAGAESCQLKPKQQLLQCHRDYKVKLPPLKATLFILFRVVHTK